MNLLMDVGNSRIKTAFTTVNGLHELKPFAYDLANCRSLLADQIGSLEVPNQVLVANVAGQAIADQISAFIREHLHRETKFIQVPREWGGLVNGYTDVGQLGVDRWLGLLAAWTQQRRFVSVVSCGTAVTFDTVTSDGKHLGGLIIPGLELMQRSLNQATKGINASLTPRPECELGLATDACVANGSLYAICSLVEKALSDLKIRHGQLPSLVLTGGDAAMVGRNLSQPFTIRSALILEGLAVIAEKE